MFIFVLSLLSAGPVFPQTPRIDSLRIVISGLPDNSEKVDNLLKIARAFRVIDYDSTMAYSNQAFGLSQELDYLDGYAESIYFRSILDHQYRNDSNAMILINQYIVIADSLQDRKKQAKGHYNKGNIYLETIRFKEASEELSTSLTLYLDMKDTFGIMANYNALGYAYLRQAAYDSASVYFLKAIEICEASGQSASVGSLYSNLSEVYMELKQYETAIEYIEKAIELSKISKDLTKLEQNYTAYGMILAKIEKYDEALDYYRKSMEIAVQLKDTISIYHLQNNMGVVYRDRKDYAQALHYFNLALKGYTEKEFTRGIIAVLKNIGMVMSSEGKYEEAIRYHEKMMVMAEQYNLEDYLLDAYGNISWYWMKIGNYKKAYENHVRYTELKDSIFTIEKTTVINDLTMKYEKQKDEAKILELKNANLQKDLDLRKSTIQRNAYMYTGLAVVALTLFILLYFRQKNRKDKIIADQMIRQLEEEKKLMAAKLLVEGQEEERKRIAVELHDGLGVLLSATRMQFSSIKDTSPENKPLIDRATQLLEQAAGDVRKISHNMMPGLLTNLGFYDAAEDLVDKLNESGQIRAVCEIEENLARLPENNEIMLYRIVQELVNNTLKHAEASFISLHIGTIDGKLEIRYSDDGKGFIVENMLESQSIGLKSIQSRVSFLNGFLEIQSSPGKGTRCYIRIPA